MQLIKSPLNYTGNKYRIMDQIRKYFPENIECMIDLFCGGSNLQTINKSFSKVDGVAEKEIEKLLKELETNIKYMIKPSRKFADAKLKDSQKMIDEEGKQLERKYYGKKTKDLQSVYGRRKLYAGPYSRFERSVAKSCWF